MNFVNYEGRYGNNMENVIFKKIHFVGFKTLNTTVAQLSLQIRLNGIVSRYARLQVKYLDAVYN